MVLVLYVCNRNNGMNSILRVSVVEYLNAQPLIYGLENHSISNKIYLSKDIPSECARKLLSNEVDVGLVPVAIIPALKRHKIIGNSCIGAIGKVASVLLCSQVPLHEINKVILDYHSRTSVKLVQILSKYYWKITPDFVDAKENYINEIEDTTAGVIIGNRTFHLNNNYRFIYDLSEAWYNFTKLPFVFAAWLGNNDISLELEHEFNEAINYGLQHIDEVIQQQQKIFPNYNVDYYLKHNIQFHLDSAMQNGLELFLSYIK